MFPQKYSVQLSTLERLQVTNVSQLYSLSFSSVVLVFLENRKYSRNAVSCFSRCLTFGVLHRTTKLIRSATTNSSPHIMNEEIGPRLICDTGSWPTHIWWTTSLFVRQVKNFHIIYLLILRMIALIVNLKTVDLNTTNMFERWVNTQTTASGQVPWQESFSQCILDLISIDIREKQIFLDNLFHTDVLLLLVISMNYFLLFWIIEIKATVSECQNVPSLKIQRQSTVKF